MTTWNDLILSAPDLGAAARALLGRTGPAEGMLATVRPGVPPRIATVKVGFVEGRLVTFVIVDSTKLRDLTEDGRYALHAHVDPAAPNELLIRGRATAVTDAALRAAAVAVWPFEVDDGYALFELSVDHVLLGRRASADEWPPVYTSWTPSAQGH
jgi:hypothetical protein